MLDPWEGRVGRGSPFCEDGVAHFSRDESNQES